MLIVSDLAMVSQFLILWRRIVLRDKDRLPRSCPDAVARAPTVPIATRSETLNLSKVEVISAERKAVDFVLVSFLRFRGMGWASLNSMSKCLPIFWLILKKSTTLFSTFKTILGI